MSALTADDRFAIMDLLARYARCIDFQRWDELPTLFTDDCTVDFGKVMGTHQGKDGVATMARMIGSTGLMMRHYSTNVIIDGDGDHVDVTSYVLAYTGSGPGQLMATTGRYEDEMVKRDGRWLLKRRRGVIEMPGAG
jgi:hypothetical protein